MNIRDIIRRKERASFGTSFEPAKRRRTSRGMNDPVRSVAAHNSDLLQPTEPPPRPIEPFVSSLEGATGAAGKEEPKVREIMTTEVQSCRADRTLVSAAAAMQRGDCRFLPVVDDSGRPIAAITDGDICEIGMRNHRSLRDIPVSEAMSREVFTCRSEDSIREALETMKRRRVRHLPVVDGQGQLAGVVSLTDVMLRVEEGEEAVLAPLRREIAEVLRVISQKQQGTRNVRVNPFRED
jgi:CBS domain-containing protein